MLRQAASQLRGRILSNSLNGRVVNTRCTCLSAANGYTFRGISHGNSYGHDRIDYFHSKPLSSSIQWRTNHYSTDAKDNVRTDQKQAEQAAPSKRRMADDIKEFTERAATGNTASFDTHLIPINEAKVFPRIKTTSLSTKRIVIHDEAMKCSATLVVVAFRSFADEQLQSWRGSFLSQLPQDRVKWYDVTINESFGAQALSGFIQRLQRGRTDPLLHDYYVAFNSKAREPLETLLPSANRMFGYALLLDRQARVRFRASGMATQGGIEALLRCAKKLIEEDQGQAISK